MKLIFAIMVQAGLFLLQTRTSRSLSPPSREKLPAVKTFEDDEVRVSVPAGWARAVGSYPAIQATKGQGNAVSQAPKKLLLQKGNYILGLAYETDHASGISGGRFLEAFHIPWLDWDRSEGCRFKYVEQPADRVLLFTNLILEGGDLRVRASCGLQEVTPEQIEGPNRSSPMSIMEKWFGGYFTSGEGGVFFDEQNSAITGCHSKVYSLTTTAKTYSQLPNPYDPVLHRTIQEAIDIVRSIHYKKCAPRLAFPFER